MEFSRLQYWSGYPFPSPGYLPDPGIEPGPPTLQVNSLPSEPPEEKGMLGEELAMYGAEEQTTLNLKGRPKEKEMNYVFAPSLRLSLSPNCN